MPSDQDPNHRAPLWSIEVIAVLFILCATMLILVLIH